MKKYKVWKHQVVIMFCSLFSLGSCIGGGKPEEYPVFYDFVENFALAEAPREVTQIDFDTKGARRHFRGGWSIDNKGKAWGMGDKSTLEFFLLEAREIEMTFKCWPYRFPGAPLQTLSITLNRQEIEQITLEGTMQEYRVILSRHILVSGKNSLEFHYGYARRPADVTPGSTDARRLAVLWEYIRFDIGMKRPLRQARLDAETGSLYIPFGVKLDYYLKLPRKSVLTFDALSLQENSSARLQLSMQREGREEQIIKTPDASAGFLAIPLSDDPSEVVRLSFHAISSEQDFDDSAGVMLTRPAIRLKNLQKENETENSVQQMPSSNPGGTNVIIYVADALRADHLGCYGYGKPVSPNIDAFAQDAILFENAVAQAPHTKATVPSIFTGVWPGTHGVKKWNDSLSDSAITLAEILKAEGYSTNALNESAQLVDSGFDQGFDDFISLLNKAEVRKGVQFHRAHKETARHEFTTVLNEYMYEWLDNERDESPFFLYVHTMAPHSPYNPPEMFRQKFAGSLMEPDLSPGEKELLHKRHKQLLGRPSRTLPKLGSRTWLDALKLNELVVSQDLIDNMVSIYDAEVARADRNFGTFLEGLKQRDLYNGSLIVFLSDHGEEFYDHEGWEHGRTLYSEVLSIPLIMKLPVISGVEKKRIPQVAQQIDILPTVLEYLGIGIPKHVEGQSLFAFLSAGGKMEPAHRVLSYLHNGGNRQGASVIEYPWKLIWNWAPGWKMELFNHEKDPSDQFNLSEQHPILTHYLTTLIKAREQSGMLLESDKVIIDEELRRKLKALGYIQ